jgi:pyruvate dehydrogenase E1 component
VVTLKYGKALEAAFAEPGGEALRAGSTRLSNADYAALTYLGGAAWRERLLKDSAPDEAAARRARRRRWRR